jgi:hypothetical protein
VRANVNRKLRRAAIKIKGAHSFGNRGMFSFDTKGERDHHDESANLIEILPEAGATTSDVTESSDLAVAQKLAALTARVDRQQAAAEESRRQIQDSLDAIQETLNLLMAQQN